MSKPIDLTGTKFGKLLVLGLDEPYVTQSGIKIRQWRCKCDCGGEITVRGEYLRRGQKTHCDKCQPPMGGANTDNLCRDCMFSDYKDGWVCKKGRDPSEAKLFCGGYCCGEFDKVTGLRHSESKCFICGAPVYSNTNEVGLYCYKHKAYAKQDDEAFKNIPNELLLGLIAGIFIRARDDYLRNPDGTKEDARRFLKSEWAQLLSITPFDADEVLRRLDEEIENGLQ